MKNLMMVRSERTDSVASSRLRVLLTSLLLQVRYSISVRYRERHHGVHLRPAVRPNSIDSLVSQEDQVCGERVPGVPEVLEVPGVPEPGSTTCTQTSIGVSSVINWNSFLAFSDPTELNPLGVTLRIHEFKVWMLHPERSTKDTRALICTHM